MTAPPRSGGISPARLVEGALFALLLIPLARWAPPLSRLLRPLFVRVTWVALPRRRASLRRLGRRVLGPQASAQSLDAHGREVLSNIQSFIADVATIDRRSVAELAARVDRIEGLEHLEPRLAERRGVILASAHLGCFESAVATLRAVSDVPIHIAYSRDALRAFERTRARARRHLNIVEQPIEAGVATWMALRDALEQGAVVAILADRVLAAQSAIIECFLGAPARLPNGPLRLAALAQAPIVPTFVIPQQRGGMVLRCEPPIWVDRDHRVQDGPHPAQRQLVAAMERAILAAPAHWLTVDGPWLDETS